MDVMSDYTLIIGSRSGSSWSLRPWILMRQFGIAMQEVLVHLRRPETGAELARHSPSALVPALKVGNTTIWDSLAIAEFLAEAHPDKAMWPKEPMTRAVARAVAAEMHAGFRDMRYALPFDVNARGLTAGITAGVAKDIRRVVRVWQDTRNRYGQHGPFLFGGFSIADAMYAPVASRFTTYAVDLADYGDDGSARAYRDSVMALPAMAEWAAAAAQEPPLPAYSK